MDEDDGIPPAAAAAAAEADGEDGAEAAAPQQVEEQSAVAEAPPDVEKWSTRTKKTLGYMRRYMQGKDSVSFNQLVSGRVRADAAGAFFEMLALKTHSCVDLAQTEPYGDITITRDRFFDTVAV